MGRPCLVVASVLEARQGMGLARWVVRWSLAHRLFRSNGVLDLDGSAMLCGGTGAGGVVRDGVSQAGGEVVLEVGLMSQRSSSLSDGSTTFGVGLGPLRSTVVLLRLLPPPPPPHGPVIKT
jgi:hypothetical protein